MLDRVWKSLRGDNNVEPATHDDRRAHTRHTVDLETTCHPIGDAANSERVRVSDISRGGMRFIIRKKLEPGALVHIHLPGGSEIGCEVLACVIHSNPQSDGSYAIGCAFSDELSDEDLRPFGGRKESTPGQDKRAWIRFPAQGTVEYVVLPPTGEPAKHAEIANISPTGIGLFLDEKIEPGAILDLLLKTRSSEQTIDILACVVFLGRRSEGGWIAGCHFVRELVEADIKRLI